MYSVAHVTLYLLKLKIVIGTILANYLQSTCSIAGKKDNVHVMHCKNYSRILYLYALLVKICCLADM